MINIFDRGGFVYCFLKRCIYYKWICFFLKVSTNPHGSMSCFAIQVIMKAMMKSMNNNYQINCYSPLKIFSLFFNKVKYFNSCFYILFNMYKPGCTLLIFTEVCTSFYCTCTKTIKIPFHYNSKVHHNIKHI